jgi:hypothetical protein
MGRRLIVIAPTAVALLLLCAAGPSPALAAAAATDACDLSDDPASCAASSAAAAARAAASGGAGGALPAPDELDYFPGVPDRVLYKGPDSDDPFSYRYYNAHEEVCAPAAASANGSGKKAAKVCKPMKDWLRMSVAFWHSMRADGSDPFGAATKRWPWGAEAAAADPRGSLDEMQLAFRAMHANFQLLRILGLEFWSFHDR